MAQDEPVGAEAIRLLGRLREEGAERAVHLAATERRAEDLARFLRAAAPDLGVVLLPPWDCLPYDWAAPSAAAMGRRMAALHALAGDGPRLVITSPAAAIQRLPAAPPAPLVLRAGEEVDADALPERLAALAYDDDGRVDEPGEATLRGAVLDVFPAAADGPVRVEIENGRVLSVRTFDAATQRTTGEGEAVTVGAASELPGAVAAAHAHGEEHWLPNHVDGLATLLDHLPGALVVATGAALDAGAAAIDALGPAHDERLEAELEAGGARRPLAPARLYLTRDEWSALRGGAVSIDLEGAAPPPAVAADRRPRAALRRAVAEAERTILVAATERDRRRLAAMAGGEPMDAPTLDDALRAEVATLLAPLERGHRDGGLLVLTARDVLGHGAEDGAGRTVAPPWLAEAHDLHEGDLVVHEEDGLGRFEGLEEVDGGEALRIAYAEEEVRLVPAAQAGLVWRYGHEAEGVALDRLGAADWTRRRARFAGTLAKTARAMAAEARRRAEAEAPAIRPDAAGMEAVAAGFPFEETPDQRAAIRDVLADMASGRPMDRLLIGDVGFGKTEVAIRAVAAAALAGRQAAVVAPTTVLARQHLATFRRRLEPAGIEVAGLSRLSRPAEAKRVRAGLADGTVRVVVGTHAVLGKSVRFKDLGLVVVDEEQRFGRAHKRALRELGHAAHALSMTATPIPGSLQGAIAGLRPISVLATAPLRRRPIRTVVAPREPGAMRAALARERRRGGQSFVVVPRIEDVEAARAALAELVPDLSVRVAHGDLPAREIDEAMTAFAAGDGDVLLATTIVESGLDVPRANTVVVLRPDLLGLAQLHQLRGRVGRGARQAYCWLMTEPDDPPSEPALRRLEAAAAADALGAGFALSVADLDRRGAGDLFGEAQTGHDARIGPALHAAMLAAALREEAGEGAPVRPEIRIDAPWRLPADYIPRADVRATLYVRLGRVPDPEAALRLADEVEDRYGPPPEEARAALRLAALRAAAARLGARAVVAGPEAAAIDFPPGGTPEAVPDGVERAEDRLLLRRPAETPEDRLAAAADLLAALS